MKEDLTSMDTKCFNRREKIGIKPVGEKMNGLVERYMDEETIRLICFFLKNKFNPHSRLCKGCARLHLCERDALKMLKFIGYIPWLEEENEIDNLKEKMFGKQRCRSCEF